MAEEFDDKKLDSPLIVHKVTDASYQETANEIEVDFTHTDDDDTATLERHRYRKVEKAKKWPYILAASIVAALIIICALYFSGVFAPSAENDIPEKTSGYLETEENKFSGIITVKGNYIFFEGEEVDGVNGLVSEIKYLDKGASFIIQNENANSTLLNEEIIPVLNSYGIKYEIKIIVSSGLISAYEANENNDESSAPAE